MQIKIQEVKKELHFKEKTFSIELTGEQLLMLACLVDSTNIQAGKDEKIFQTLLSPLYDNLKDFIFKNFAEYYSDPDIKVIKSQMNAGYIYIK